MVSLRTNDHRRLRHPGHQTEPCRAGPVCGVHLHESRPTDPNPSSRPSLPPTGALGHQDIRHWRCCLVHATGRRRWNPGSEHLGALLHRQEDNDHGASCAEIRLWILHRHHRSVPSTDHPTNNDFDDRSKNTSEKTSPHPLLYEPHYPFLQRVRGGRITPGKLWMSNIPRGPSVYLRHANNRCHQATCIFLVWYVNDLEVRISAKDRDTVESNNGTCVLEKIPMK